MFSKLPVIGSFALCVLLAGCHSGSQSVSSISSALSLSAKQSTASNGEICASVAENSNASIKCPTGQVVTSIAFASYGSPTGACGSYKANASCNAPTSLSVVQAACVGKASCSVGANNGVFPDPCSGVGKSMKIEAVCGTAGSSSTSTGSSSSSTGSTGSTSSSADVCATVAEHSNATVTCPSGQVISKIVFASFGSPTGSCGAFKASTSCNAPTSMSVATTACLGQASCTILADDGTFPDPCSGIQKSFDIDVQCAAASTASTGTGSSSTSTGSTSTGTGTTSTGSTSTGSSSSSSTGTGSSSTSTGSSSSSSSSPPTSGGTGSWTNDLDANHAALGLYTIGDSGYLVSTPGSSTNKPYGFSVYNEMGQVVAALSAVKQSNGTYNYVLPTNKYGYFEIKPTEGTAASLIPAIGSRPAGVLTYAVLAAPDTNPSNNFQDEFTSVQGTTLEPGANAMGSGTFPWMGYSTYGVSAYSWGDCEPNQATATADCTNFLNSDPYPAIFQNAKMIPLFYMNNMPLWGTSSTTGSSFGYPPANFTTYAAYLEFIIPKIVARYSFVPVRKYQITWEPNDGWGWSGTDAQFIQLYQTSYTIIKKYDPNAKIIGPTLANLGPAMTSQFSRLLGLGLGNYLDGVSSHPYPAYSQIYGLDDGWIANFRALATTAMGRVIPFYATESGLSTYEMGIYGTIPVNNNYNVYHAVGNAAMALLEKNDGSSLHTYFYTADYSAQPLYGMFYNATVAYTYGPSKVSPKVDVPVIRQANILLNHSVGVGQLVSPGGNANLEVFIYKNKNTGIYTAVLWDPSGTNGTIALKTGASQVTQMDAFGNASTVNVSGGVLNLTLGIEPIYIQGLGSAALTGLTASGPVGN